MFEDICSSESAPRERILSAAHRLFYGDGIRATGIDRVIAEAGVTKVTFYRQFPSKDDLVLAVLERRHQRWLAWFTQALARHGSTPAAVVPALREWFSDAGFRGCAFINSVGELGGALPTVVAAARAHKADMAAALMGLLPPGADQAVRAGAMALAVDGAIVQAQRGPSHEEALQSLAVLLQALEVSRTGVVG